MTKNIVVFFFANAVIMVVFQSAIYTRPFILSNKFVQQESSESKDTSKEGFSFSQSGVAMASTTVMISASDLVVSLAMGPLMDANGYPGTPIFFALVSCALGVVVTLFDQLK